MKKYYDHGGIVIWHGDCREVLPTMEPGSVQCCVTSPPYWGLRDYGVAGQLGLEPTPEEFVGKLVEVFREVRRVLRDDGTLWLNLGDSYAQGEVRHRNGRSSTLRDGNVSENEAWNAGTHQTGRRLNHGLKPKDLVGIPWRVAFALQADGWYLRSDIIWHKPNPMPESITDRPTKGHEYLFLLAKSKRYYYNADAIREPGVEPVGVKKQMGAIGRAESMGRAPSGNEGPGRSWVLNGFRNLRSVWTVATESYPGAHFAVFPRALIEPCILAGCPEGGTVLDPFVGSGTTLEVAREQGCRAIGIELNESYCVLAAKRLEQGVFDFGAVEG